MVHLPVALPKILLSEVNFTNLPCTLVKTAVRTYNLHYIINIFAPSFRLRAGETMSAGEVKDFCKDQVTYNISFSLGWEINRTLIREQNGFSVTGMNQYAVC